MAEMLTAVAIILVLTAVAVPAIFTISKNLKMRELDDTAREIFLAAQNALSARKADGTLVSPQGTPATGQDGLYWLFDGEAEFLLPDGAVEPVAAENHIAIWYNAGSAMVLEVYYGERTGSFASPAAQWDEGGMQGGKYSGPNGTAARREQRVGYYNGNDLDRGGVEQLLPPALEIVNEDELTVKITVPDPGAYWTNGVSLSVTVEELDGGAPTGNIVEFPCTYSSVDGAYELVLDSLTAAKRFRAVCPGLTPGADLRVTAKLSAPEKDGIKYLSSSTWAEANSLFERRTGNTVSVAWARHLQNLEDDFPGFDGGSGVGAVQTDSIDWGKTGTAFQSIENTRIASYSGNGLEIRGLNGGLFGSTAAGMKLEGIRIVNPRIDGSGTAVGALANTANGAEINDCRVYATTVDPEKAGSQSEDFSRLGSAFTVSGQTAGGLIGSAQDCAITNSFAALSQVQGGIAGGLIGSAQNCTIKNCYATAETLSGSTSAMFIGHMTGGAVSGCYAAGNIASTSGTISGFANGSGTFTGSYCAVSYNDAEGKPTSAKPLHGFAPGGSGCVYLKAKTPTGSDGAKGMSYKELENWDVWQTLSPAQTRPYREELDGKAYPFPGLDMPHYGSWPVQTATYIKLFSAEVGGTERKMILVPAGGEATVWAENDGGADTMVEWPQKEDDSGLIVLPTVDQGEERAKLTVKAKPDQTGVTYVDLEAGGYQLRAVVVVYQVEVTLDGENTTDAALKATGTADQAGKETIGQLILRTNAKEGAFTASLTRLAPTQEEVLQALDTLRASLDQAVLSAEEKDFDNWKKVKDSDPAVTANGNPGAGAYILAPVDGNYYPTASEGKLTVTGAASGTATVSARWAMNESVAAKCDVKMEGARALIQAVSAEGKDGTLGHKEGYPYYLSVRAEPGETVRFTFTPRLFGGSGTGTYTWTISGEDRNFSETKAVTGAGDTWTYALGGVTGWHYYNVTLLYTNDAGERSVDYMTFSVYCEAKRQLPEYDAIQIERSDGQGVLNTGTTPFSASVEQINDPTTQDYAHTAELELQSWVAGAQNTRVRWFYSTDGGTSWERVTGHAGAISIQDGKGRIRATVEWMNDKQEYNSVSTGGAVRITGLDVNEYDEPFTFQLRSEAVEATENGDATAAARTVTVTVMNKLRLTPQTYTGYSGSDITLSANRTDQAKTGWAYNWQISPTGNTSFPNNAANLTEIKFKVNSEGERLVTLKYGPHTETAILRTVGGNYDLLTTVNWDAQWNGSDYFLVEKGTSRELTNSWFVGSLLDLYRARMTTEPSNGSSAATITPLSGAGSTSVGDVVETGRRYYTVAGREFCDPQDITWHYNHGLVWLWNTDRFVATNPNPTDYTVKLAVVGMDLNWPGKSGDTDTSISIPGLNTSTTVTADWSFPKELIVSGEPDIQWEISDPDLVDFADGNTGETVRLTAKKYSSEGYSATITATCTVPCTNGRTYTYKKHASIEVSPNADMSLTVEPCTAVDASGLSKAFPGGGLTADSLLAAVDEDGTPVLIKESGFGCGTLYLKVQAQLLNSDGNAVGNANLNEYFHDLRIDRSFVDMETALSDDGETMYVRLSAKESTEEVFELELNATIGSAKLQQPLTIKLYDHPVVTLTRDGADVTNGSVPVYQDHTTLSATLQAALTPVLHRAGDPAAEPLDQIQWYLEAPEGYNAESYLSMIQNGPGEVTVSIRDKDRMPDFRVVLHARSARSDQSDAGYALVFLPVEEKEDTP